MIKVELFTGASLVIPGESRISKKLAPQITITAYPYTPPRSIYDPLITAEEKSRHLLLMSKLRKQCNEVPVIRAKKFNNACYIQKLNEIKASEEEWRQFCNDWGMDYDEFINNIGPHMVIIGDSFATAPTLAHEFGHYINTINHGTHKGYVAHKYYGLGVRLNRLGSIINTLTVLSALWDSPKGRKEFESHLKTRSDIYSITSLFKIASATPVLIAEAAASQTGLLNLARVGATESELTTFKKDLKGAYGTYKQYYMWFPIIKMSIVNILSLVLTSRGKDLMKSIGIKK